MPRSRATRAATAPPTSGVGPFIVRNPRAIPTGRHILRYHACADGRDDPEDHSGCDAYTWFEGDTLEPPEGFGLERFLQHQPMPGRSCDDGHENCAGPFLEEVSADG